MWLALLIIGIILLVLGWFVPLPYPGKQLLIAGGVICVVVGLILLILGVVTVSRTDDTPTHTHVGAPSTVMLV